MNRHQYVVLVVGPPLAGVDGVAAALRGRLPDHVLVETAWLDPHRAPDAVIAVVSAVAPLTRSDWGLIALAAARTDLVIGVVSKIDAHRTWRDVLEADRALVTQWAPRGGRMAWVGVAAAPHLGEPNVTHLVAELRDGLADPDLDRRNTLTFNAYRPPPTRGRPPSSAVDSRVALQRVRLHLLRFVRAECASMRNDLRTAASAIPAGGTDRFGARVRDDADRFLNDVDGEITRAVAEFAPERVATSQPAPVAPDIAAAPSASNRLETRLMAVLGLGFGLGIALASNRVLSGLAPGLSVGGWVAGGLIGTALVIWVVRTRGVLHERALLDRWVTEVAAALRWHAEAMVAERLLALEATTSRTPGEVKN